MNILGRNKEQKQLDRAVQSNKPEFLVVYGRRRIGKTYLIKNYFKDEFSFYTSGVDKLKTKEEIKVFYNALKMYGCNEKSIPNDWFEAFDLLRNLLESKAVKRVTSKRKRVIFLDEIPWMDTPKSNFKAALDYFWNTYASTKDDILLIVCGSATSWVIENIIKDTGGFYNRLTDKIHLFPFSLGECESFLSSNNIKWSKETIIQCYMIFGGVPYYLNLLDNTLSLAQNVNNLVFLEGGTLYNEYYELMSSLFKNHELHSQIISALGNHHNGLLRNDLINKYKLQDGAPLTRALRELEECGFIRKYNNSIKSKNDSIIQLVDPFTLFCIEYKEKNEIQNWLTVFNTSKYHSWCGYAFEILVLNHVQKIKEILGVSGVESNQYALSLRNHDRSSQIDLIIDRKDGIINLCEMKYSNSPYVITKSDSENLYKKLEMFQKYSNTKSSVLITFITSGELKQNEYSDVVQISIRGDMLF